jgi:4-hydroxy-4-methyl-2-oxoglutarate aldolase
LVIGGGVRDVTALTRLGFPVFAHGVCLVGTVKDADPRGRIGEPVMIGEVLVCRGDLVVGDSDGVAVLPALRVDEVMREAAERERKEADMMTSLRAGSTTLELLGLRAAPDMGTRGMRAGGGLAAAPEELR